MSIKKNRTKLINFLLILLCVSLAACTDVNKVDNSKTKTMENTELSNTLVYAGESADTINPILNTHDELPNIIFSGLMRV